MNKIDEQLEETRRGLRVLAGGNEKPARESTTRPVTMAPRLVTLQQMREGLLQSLFLKSSRELDLLSRTPPFCKARGWFPDSTKAPNGVQKGFAFVALAVAAYSVGARGQRLPVPKDFCRHEQWAALVKQYGPEPTAEVIVEAMELDELLGREAQHEAPPPVA